MAKQLPYSRAIKIRLLPLRQWNVNIETVQRTMKRWIEEGNVYIKKKTGRPQSVSTRRLNGIIKKKIDRDDGVSMNRIASTLGIGFLFICDWKQL